MNEIDYSNTIIYKITCKDTQVTDVYVGHTTNFVQRKHSHRQNCKNNNCKLYEVIRANGGWSNWSMDIINFFNCKDLYEARIKEQEYFLLLRATLNSIEPLSKSKVDIHSNKLLEECTTHLVADEEIIQNNPDKTSKHCCEHCNYKCNKNSEYIKHLLTAKHIGNASGNTKKHTANYKCKYCMKIYKSRKGLWSHNKICIILPNDIKTHIDNTEQKDKIIELLIKENYDVKHLVLEMIKSNTDLQQKQMLDLCNTNTIISQSNI
jgi:hypothetical protein